MELDEKKIPTIFKAFCDENRVKILKLFWYSDRTQRGEMDALLYFREWRAVCNRLSTSAYDYKCSI